MKWYVYAEDDTSYTMILDHNTTSNVAYNSDNDNGVKKEVQTELDNLVNLTKWQVTPRLITGQETADITENKSWISSGDWFFFDSNTQTQIATSTGASKYYWLLDYTYSCTDYGCKVVDSNSNNYGYWTDTSYDGDSTRVWRVHYSGGLGRATANDTSFGVRPVITVSKSYFNA